MPTTDQRAIDLMPQLRDLFDLASDQDLPKLYRVTFAATDGDAGWTVHAQLLGGGTDLEAWEALRAWGGHGAPLLSIAYESDRYPSGSYRKAWVEITVAEVTVEVWAHVDSAFVPPKPELVHATGPFADVLLGMAATA